jgi:hypothetical protein
MPPSASPSSLERVIRMADLGVGGESGFGVGALVAPADVVADRGVLHDSVKSQPVKMPPVDEALPAHLRPVGRRFSPDVSAIRRHPRSARQ